MNIEGDIILHGLRTNKASQMTDRKLAFSKQP